MLKVFLSFIVLFSGKMAFSQIDFTGTWVNKETKYLKGPHIVNALPRKKVIIQKHDSLIIESISVGPEGNDVSKYESFATDGGKSTGVSNFTQKKYSRYLIWSVNNDTLILTTIFYSPENQIEFSRIETWAFSSNGKQLNIHKKSLETNIDNWEVVGIFEKH